MFNRKIIIITILGTAGFVLFAVLFITLLLPKLNHVNFNVKSTPPPVTILLVKGDVERLPTFLSEPLLALNPPVNLEEAPYVNCDAVLISREQLFESGKDLTVRNQLVSIIMNHKILLVYHVTTTDIANQLDLGTPVGRTETTYTAIASAALTKNIIAAGGVLLSKGHSEENLLQDIREYVSNFRSVIHRKDTNVSGGNEFIILTPEIVP